jgi:hypothetical protein
LKTIQIIFFTDKLAEAKELVYLEGFYEGKMPVGVSRRGQLNSKQYK